MTSQVEAHLKDYVWMSVVEYMRWVEVNCDLYDFSSNDIWSFNITAKGGILALRSKKIKTLDRLKANVKVIEEFAQDSKVAGDRLDVIKTLVRNMGLYIKIIAAHIETLDGMAATQATLHGLEYVPLEDGEIPF